MRTFTQFLEQTKQQSKDVEDSLDKLPKSHRKLIKGYKIKWHHDNTLPGDEDHVGLLNPERKTITIAAPYNYSREHTLLHELGHMVWQNIMTPELVEKWKKIVKRTKDKPKQNAEELFCHAYSTYYCKNKNEKFNYPEWMEFIKDLPK